MSDPTERRNLVLEELTPADLDRLKAAGIVDNTLDNWEAILRRDINDPTRCVLEDLLMEVSRRHPVRWDLIYGGGT